MGQSFDLLVHDGYMHGDVGPVQNMLKRWSHIMRHVDHGDHFCMGS